MEKASVKTKDVAGRQPAEHTGEPSPASPTQDASKRPVWTRQINRVDCSIWRHRDQDGQSRYTVAISKSYFHKATQRMKRDYYFDRRDLSDVVMLCHDAEEQILRIDGLIQTTGED